MFACLGVLACNDSTYEESIPTIDTPQNEKKLYELTIAGNSRVALNDDFSCDWELGDSFTVLNESNEIVTDFTVTSVAQDGSATITSEDGIGDGSYRIFYPSFTNRTETINLFEQVQANATSNEHITDNDLMLSNVVTISDGSANGSVSFMHALGMIEFKLTATEECELQKIIVTSLTDNWFWDITSRYYNGDNAATFGPGNLVCYGCTNYSKTTTLTFSDNPTITTSGIVSTKILAACLWQTNNLGNLQVIYVTDKGSIVETIATDGVIKGFESGNVYNHSYTLDVATAVDYASMDLVPSAETTKEIPMYVNSVSFPVNALEGVSFSVQNLKYADESAVPAHYTWNVSLSGTTATVNISTRNGSDKVVIGQIVVNCTDERTSTVTVRHTPSWNPLGAQTATITASTTEWTPGLAHPIHAYRIVSGTEWLSCSNATSFVTEGTEGWKWSADSYNAGENRGNNFGGAEVWPTFSCTTNSSASPRTAVVEVRWMDAITTYTITQEQATNTLTPLEDGVVAGNYTAEVAGDNQWGYDFTPNKVYTKAQYDAVATELKTNNNTNYNVGTGNRYDQFVAMDYNYALYTSNRAQYPLLIKVTNQESTQASGAYHVEIIACEEPHAASTYTNNKSYYDATNGVLVIEFDFGVNHVHRTLTKEAPAQVVENIAGTYTTVTNTGVEGSADIGTQLAFDNTIYTYDEYLATLSDGDFKTAIIASPADYAIKDAENGVFLFNYNGTEITAVNWYGSFAGTYFSVAMDSGTIVEDTNDDNTADRITMVISANSGWKVYTRVFEK